jgi:hypothetical protein
MAAPKGQPKPESSGRKKGVVNKTTADIKEMINNALHLAGGEDYLVRQADENPVAFMGLIGKILPKEIAAELSGNLTIASITRRIIDSKEPII